MATFYSAPCEDGGISLRFDDEPISIATYRKYVLTCTQNLLFGEIDATTIKELLDKAKISLRESPSCCKVTEVNPVARVAHMPGLDIFQAQSIHRHVVCQYNISNSYRLKKICPELTQGYASGASIQQLSQSYRLSPFNIFKCIAEHIDAFKPNSLHLLALGKIQPEDVLNPRDAQEYRYAEKFDSNSIAVQLKIARIAAIREANFVNFLRNGLGISLRTQEELFEEAKDEGKQPITPDALFDSKVIINGRKAKWIDFKAYFGTHVNFLLKSTIAQSRKYTDAFGPGAIVYEYGCLPDMPFWSVSARSLVDIIDEGTIEKILM